MKKIVVGTLKIYLTVLLAYSLYIPLEYKDTVNKKQAH